MAEKILKNLPPSEDAPSSKKRKYPVVDDVPPRRIMFLGDEGIGKTTFIRNYCEHMREHYRCETYRCKYLMFRQFCLYCERGEKLVPTQFLDLPAGLTAEYRREQYPRYADLVVLCFAVDDLTSFNNVRRVWLRESEQRLPASTTFRLLGLKSDMRERMLDEGKIPVTEERAIEINEEIDSSGEYLECSVEENAQMARHRMDMLIAGLILSEANRPRIV